MADEIERNLGPQPIGGILEEKGLRAQDLVAASTEQITHKMVSRAVKGRRLTPNTQAKVLNALQAATGETFELRQLFDY
jgi:hypothetical protein